MILNRENKLYCVNLEIDLDNLKSLYVKEVRDTLDQSFEAAAAKRMYGYKFEQDSELKSLRLRLNPYLVFFENQISDESQTLNNGLCVMYPSTLVTGEIESHVKFVGNSGALLYKWAHQNKSASYSVDEIISMFIAMDSRINAKVAIQKMKKLIELLITDLFLIIE